MIEIPLGKADPQAQVFVLVDDTQHIVGVRYGKDEQMCLAWTSFEPARQFVRRHKSDPAFAKVRGLLPLTLGELEKIATQKPDAPRFRVLVDPMESFEELLVAARLVRN